MPGFGATQLNFQTRNSNTVAILVGDQVIAFAQTTSHSFDMGAEGLYGIGSAKPQEIQQLKVSPQITIDNFDLTNQGLRLNQGNVTPLVSFLANNNFNISIIDGSTEQPTFTYVGCVAQGFNQSIPSNQVITDAVTFLAMDVLGPDGTSLHNGPTALTITAGAGLSPAAVIGA